jgi:hypothetical protein
MEEMTIKCSKVGCGLEWPWEGRAAIIFCGENQQVLRWEEGVRKEVAVCGRAIKWDHSTWLPTSLTQQTNGNDG